ncbi:MAG: hypothetical protein CM1200mP26_16030 [Acidimicrobiales bacterium]|nr:MAG: hypothetical protein CM1200mP26_16030 [Acidimicrobiales bacterium]
MTEIPEHLRKRAEAAKAKAKGATDAPAGDAAPRWWRAAKRRKDPQPPSRPWNCGGRPAGNRRRRARRAPPGSSGPDGHNQRLLTVVKSGSIQDTKATPQDKVHVWPHLLLAEFLAALAITLFSLLFSIFVNAPLLELADFNKTPNPSKAPWYFLGLQELLTMFHPMVAGVTIPGIGLFVLILAPYIDKNPSKRPEDRKFAISLMTVHLMFWAVLVMIGSFFRGPGFNFIFPWNSGLFFEL